MHFNIIASLLFLPFLSLGQNVAVVRIHEDDGFGDLIESELIRYTPEGDVLFYDSEYEGTDDGFLVRQSEITETGQWVVPAEPNMYVYVTDEGLLQVRSESTTQDGIFYVDNATLYYDYYAPFIACQVNSHRYQLIWRESGAECDNSVSTLVYIRFFNQGNQDTVDTYPDNYDAGIAATAIQNTATATETSTSAASAAATSSSANGSGKMSVGAGVMFFIAMLI